MNCDIKDDFNIKDDFDIKDDFGIKDDFNIKDDFDIKKKGIIQLSKMDSMISTWCDQSNRQDITQISDTAPTVRYNRITNQFRQCCYNLDSM